MLALAWAAVPVLSIGLLSWVPFLYMAARTRAPKFARLAALYLSLTLLTGVLLGISGQHDAARTIAGLLLITLGASGCAHTLSLRREYGRQLELADDPRMLQAEQRSELRERALSIVRHDPKRALEMGIGRPDVPGSFDAGLVDVNHAGPEVLATLPGIDAAKAARIVELRMNGSGFESPEDLDMVLDVDPGTLAELRARAVFLPRF
jgi:Helix-hairpin-helix motif